VINLYFQVLKNNKLKQTARKQMRAVRRVIGKVLSTTSTSLANRLTIRPMGVVSKNDMGFDIILTSIPSCNILQAAIVPIAKVMLPISCSTATVQKIRAIKFNLPSTSIILLAITTYTELSQELRRCRDRIPVNACG